MSSSRIWNCIAIWPLWSRRPGVPCDPGETLTPEQTAYFNAVLDYVKECRPLLNQGQYHLPEPPQLADFDQSLQDYKKQIEAELEQEAAAAGLTVEEYVASDYEAPAQPNFSIYQVPPGPEGARLPLPFL